MSNILKPIAGIASAIPGPQQAWAKGALGLFSLLGSNKQQAAGNAGIKGMEGLTQEQIKMLLALNPQLLANAKDAEAQYQQYDPHADTEAGLRAFDQAANESAARDYGNARTGLSLRGLGNSTEATGAASQIAAQRSSARGKLASDLTLGERERKQGALSFANNATTQALGGPAALQSPINNLGQTAGFRFDQASQYDPTALIGSFGDAFKGVKLPWQKKPTFNRNPSSTTY